MIKQMYRCCKERNPKFKDPKHSVFVRIILWLKKKNLLLGLCSLKIISGSHYVFILSHQGGLTHHSHSEDWFDRETTLWITLLKQKCSGGYRTSSYIFSLQVTKLTSTHSLLAKQVTWTQNKWQRKCNLTRSQKTEK